MKRTTSEQRQVGDSIATNRELDFVGTDARSSRIPTARTPTMILIEVDHFTHFSPPFPTTTCGFFVSAAAAAATATAAASRSSTSTPSSSSSMSTLPWLPLR